MSQQRADSASLCSLLASLAVKMWDQGELQKRLEEKQKARPSRFVASALRSSIRRVYQMHMLLRLGVRRQLWVPDRTQSWLKRRWARARVAFMW